MMTYPALESSQVLRKGFARKKNELQWESNLLYETPGYQGPSCLPELNGQEDFLKAPGWDDRFQRSVDLCLELMRSDACPCR